RGDLVFEGRDLLRERDLLARDPVALGGELAEDVLESLVEGRLGAREIGGILGTARRGGEADHQRERGGEREAEPAPHGARAIRRMQSEVRREGEHRRIPIRHDYSISAGTGTNAIVSTMPS